MSEVLPTVVSVVLWTDDVVQDVLSISLFPFLNGVLITTSMQSVLVLVMLTIYTEACLVYILLRLVTCFITSLQTHMLSFS